MNETLRRSLRAGRRSHCAGATLLLVLLLPALALANGPSHPMDGLDAEEIGRAMDALGAAGQFGKSSLLISLDLDIPKKAEVLRWRDNPGPETLPKRRARAIVRTEGRSVASVVDLESARVLSSEVISSGQAAISTPEIFATIMTVVSDERMQEGLRKRGITDFEALFCAPRTAGNFGDPFELENRIVKADCFDLSDNPTNIFAAPIEGLFATVDLDTGQVLEVTDLGVVPVPEGSFSLSPDAQPELRKRSKAKATTRDFSLDGSVVSWENWSFHVGWSTHAGLVISDVRYQDGDESRSVLYEGHLSELYVPYMDPTEGWYFRNYFDEGDYGVGTTASPLVEGSDCPEGAAYLSPLSVSASGAPTSLDDRICVFERSVGEPSWRHFDILSEALDSRPDRDLIVRFIATVGNYDYLFDWVFDAKGRITFRGGASGLDAVKAVRAQSLSDESAAAETEYGPLIAPGRAGIHHDHFFSLRLDVDIDGTSNRFVKDELYVENLPEGSKRKSIWKVRPRVLAQDSEARLRIDLTKPSLWRVQNPEHRNAVGYPSSYVVRTGANALPLVDPKDSPLARAGFANYHLWVTPYSEDERWAGGEFPNQSEAGHGLPAWTSKGRDIDQQDIVLWYTLGFHHVPSSEDWPVYNVGWHSVTLAPYNFFDHNPAIDLPE